MDLGVKESGSPSQLSSQNYLEESFVKLVVVELDKKEIYTGELPSFCTSDIDIVASC